jgi:DNA-binding protein HU-beta
MNKAELASAVAAKTGFTKKDSDKALGAVIDAISDALKAGDKVQVVGFGTFEVKNRPARVARNPHNGEPIAVAASKAPAFKAGKALKDAVNK